MSTIRVVNIQHSDATEPNIVLEADGTTVFASGITISGDTKLTVSGTAEFASGTVSAPGITFIDDNNTGVYSPGADQVALATSGSQRLLVNSGGITSANGGVFQGDVSSYATNGLALTFNSNNSEVRACRSGGNYTNLLFYTQGANSGGVQAERVRITSEGLVGVGNSAPVGVVTIQDATTDGEITLRSAGGVGNNNRARIKFGYESGGSNYGGYFQINTTDSSNNNDPALFIDNQQRVGIGTTSPGVNLDLVGTTTSAFRIRSSASASRGFEIWNDSSTDEAYISNYYGGPIIFQTANTERARIDSSGRLLVGTSNARTDYFNSSSYASKINVEDVSASAANYIYFSAVRNTNDSEAPFILISKSRGTTYGAADVVQENDYLGTIGFQGADGGQLVEAARISAHVDAAPGADAMPGRLVFSTTGGGGSFPTERLHITRTGDFDFTGGNNNYGQIIAGFGAVTTGGTTDWNDVTNARSGNGYTLLLGSATNGPGGSSYYHAFSFEYSTKNGSGNLTQIAIPYNDAASRYIRFRYVNTWSSWSAF